jgi:hypothetical protein
LHGLTSYVHCAGHSPHSSFSCVVSIETSQQSRGCVPQEVVHDATQDAIAEPSKWQESENDALGGAGPTHVFCEVRNLFFSLKKEWTSRKNSLELRKLSSMSKV